MTVKVVLDMEQLALAAQLAAKFAVYWDDEEIGLKPLGVIIGLALQTQPNPDATAAALAAFDPTMIETYGEQMRKESGE